MYRLMAANENSHLVRFGITHLMVKGPGTVEDDIVMAFYNEEVGRFTTELFNRPVGGEILEERMRQDEQWGGPDRYDRDELLSSIERQLAAIRIDCDEARVRLIKVAALAMAAIQSIDRKQS